MAIIEVVKLTVPTNSTREVHFLNSFQKNSFPNIIHEVNFEVY